MRLQYRRRISRAGENLEGANPSVTELGSRIHRLEAIAAQRNSDRRREVTERALKRLSFRELKLLKEAISRFNDPDCPKVLKAVAYRFNTAFKEEAEKHLPSSTRQTGDY